MISLSKISIIENLRFLLIIFFISGCCTKECWDIDIKNSAENFKILENCSIIRGSLSISLIEHSSADEFEKFSFPELR